MAGPAEGMPPYPPEFYLALEDGARSSAQAMVPMVLGLVQAESVVDVGCGTGTFLAEFRRHGVEDILGIDGLHVDRALLQIPPKRFVAADLAAGLPVNRTFDLVVSLEVAEHLSPERAEAFVEGLTRLGPVVVFSAAIPHQGGRHHVNEQWPRYWAGHFERRGYLALDCLRDRLWHRPGVEWWYAQNTLLYVRPDTRAAQPALARLPVTAAADVRSLVHPRRFLEVVDWAAGLYEESGGY